MLSMETLLSRTFALIQDLYTEIPIRFSRKGYAFPPQYYIMVLTCRCNLRCKMCLLRMSRHTLTADRLQEQELSTQDWHNLIDQMRRFSMISFSGGEVFVRPDILELLAHARKRHFIHLSTNLTMVSRECAESLVNLAPRHLGWPGLLVAGTSIDGPPDVHDRIRGPGTFERTRGAIQALRAARNAAGKKFPRIHVTTVIQPDNTDVLAEMPAIAKEAGADELILVKETRVRDVADDPMPEAVDVRRLAHEDIPHTQIAPERLRESILGCIAAARETHFPTRFTPMALDDLLDFYRGKRIDLTRYQCRTPWNVQVINPEGHVGSCCEVFPGNIRDAGLAELWNGEQQRRFRIQCRAKLFAACAGCAQLAHCRRSEVIDSMHSGPE